MVLLQSNSSSGTADAGGESFTWHRAIFAGGYPPTIVAAAAFHTRVRDGSGWFHSAMDTRIDKAPLSLTSFPRVIPENCIGYFDDSGYNNTRSAMHLLFDLKEVKRSTVSIKGWNVKL